MRRNFQFSIFNFQAGFTLIELLVVISIIGVLASLIFARFTTAEKSARDIRRKSDLNQYRTALENYAVKTNGLYPSRTSVNYASILCSDGLSPTYLATCPQDPLQGDGTHYYFYRTNGSGSAIVDATQYILWAQLETVSNTYWYICANGEAVQKSGEPATSDCW